MKKKANSEFVNVGDVIIKYYRYWKWFIVSLTLCLVVAFLYIKAVEPVYYIEANVKLRTEEEGSKIASSLVRSFGLGGVAGTDNINDEAAIISSQSHMRNMIYDLGLYAAYDLKKFPFDKSLYKNTPLLVKADKSVLDTLSSPIKFNVEVKQDNTVNIAVKSDSKEIGSYNGPLPANINTSFGKFIIQESGYVSSPKSYKINITLSGLDYSAELFRKKIVVGTLDNKSDIIILTTRDTDRGRGKDILNKLVELYNNDTKEDKNEEAENTAGFIKKRIALLAIELGTLEEQLETFKRDNNLINIEAESKSFITKYQDLQERNTELSIQQNITDMLIRYVADPKNKHELIPTSTGVPANASEAINAYNGALLERSRLLQNTTENNPVIRSLDERIAMLRKNVETNVRDFQRDLTIRKKDWAGLEGEMQGRMSQMPRQERQYIEIERQRQVKSELYVFLLTKMEETQLTLASTTPKAKIIDKAFNTIKPVEPRKKVIFGLALLIGVMLPVIIIYMIDVFKTKIRTKEELEEATDIPIAGEICLDKQAGNIAVAEGLTTSTVELFRLVRTNLQFMMKKDEKVILVTSSISGEGKSFFTVNLALSFSLIKNKKVVLVGLDIRNPKLTEYLSVTRKGGLTMFLASDEMKPEEIIIHKPDLHPNIYFVPAGPIPPNPSELLLSDRLDELFEYLRAHFDYIIVDTAPVGMVSDTFSLDRIADTTVYVFRANYTNKSYLKLAESIVSEDKLKKVNMVINGTTTKSAYGYGYGHNPDNSKK